MAERTRELAAAIEELQKEIAERKYSERRLATQYAVTRVLAESDTLAAATPRLLRTISESMEWGWGALWIVDPKAAVIHCQSIWHAPNIEAAEFDAISRETVFTPGRGVPGRVWQSGSPIWIDDATKNPVVVRAPVAARTGLHTAIAFPILLRGQTLGVIEFFSHAVRQPDKEQLATLSALGNQIGQFIERKRVEEALREQERFIHQITELSPVVLERLRSRGGASQLLQQQCHKPVRLHAG